jgi:chorismate synthase
MWSDAASWPASFSWNLERPFGLMNRPSEPESLRIRPFDDPEDYEACSRLQEEVWGKGFSEKVSPAILMIANRLGGLAAGAFDSRGALVGFVFGLTGIDLEKDELVHWSDMLAVRAEARDRGLGSRLKAYQREVLLGRGVERMHWTFDPLQGRNAWVNFAKLGIRTREYRPDLYGETDSPLHRGIGTDRLVATWRMSSRRVVDRMRGDEAPPGREDMRGVPRVLAVVEEETASGEEAEPSLPAPGPLETGRFEPRLLLPVPSHVDRMMTGNLALAVRWRRATREAFLHYFGAGYEAREFVRGDPVSHYVLDKTEEGEE